MRHPPHIPRGTPGERPPSLGRHLWELFPYARPYRRWVAFGLATNVLARFFDLLPMIVIGRVVDTITAASAAGQTVDAGAFMLFMGNGIVFAGVQFGITVSG